MNVDTTKIVILWAVVNPKQFTFGRSFEQRSLMFFCVPTTTRIRFVFTSLIASEFYFSTCFFGIILFKRHSAEEGTDCLSYRGAKMRHLVIKNRHGIIFVKGNRSHSNGLCIFVAPEEENIWANTFYYARNSNEDSEKISRR